MTKNSYHISIGEFVHNAIRLPNDEFEKEMRMSNDDKHIDDVINSKGATAWTREEMEAYERL